MSLPISFDFNGNTTVRCVPAHSSDRAYTEGEYFGRIWVKDQCWAVVLWDADEKPTLYEAKLLLIEKKIWMPLLK